MNLTDLQNNILSMILESSELGGTSAFIVAPTLGGTTLICGGFNTSIDADEMDFRQMEKEGFIILSGGRWENNLNGKLTQSGIEAVKAGFASADREKGKGHRGYQFPTPPGTAWQDITIRFTDGHTVSVTMGDQASRVFNFAELGMKDGRNGNPNNQWKLLETFAQNGGCLSWQQSDAALKKKKQVQLLARRLQDFFGIEAHPFHRYQKATGWRIKARLESLR